MYKKTVACHNCTVSKEQTVGLLLAANFGADVITIYKHRTGSYHYRRDRWLQGYNQSQYTYNQVHDAKYQSIV